MATPSSPNITGGGAPLPWEAVTQVFGGPPPSGASPDLHELVTSTAQQYGVPLPIALKMVSVESGWNPNARSRAGAIGLFQLMPDTAKALGVDPYDLRQNVEGGLRYLRQMYDRYGDWGRALAAYNAGPNAVASGNWPEETRRYVAAILGSSAAVGNGPLPWGDVVSAVHVSNPDHAPTTPRPVQPKPARPQGVPAPRPSGPQTLEDVMRGVLGGIVKAADTAATAIYGAEQKLASTFHSWTPGLDRPIPAHVAVGSPEQLAVESAGYIVDEAGNVYTPEGKPLGITPGSALDLAAQGMLPTAPAAAAEARLARGTTRAEKPPVPARAAEPIHQADIRVNLHGVAHTKLAETPEEVKAAEAASAARASVPPTAKPTPLTVVTEAFDQVAGMLADERGGIPIGDILAKLEEANTVTKFADDLHAELLGMQRYHETLRTTGRQILNLPIVKQLRALSPEDKRLLRYHAEDPSFQLPDHLQPYAAAIDTVRPLVKDINDTLPTIYKLPDTVLHELDPEHPWWPRYASKYGAFRGYKAPMSRTATTAKPYSYFALVDPLGNRQIVAYDKDSKTLMAFDHEGKPRPLAGVDSRPRLGQELTLKIGGQNMPVTVWRALSREIEAIKGPMYVEDPVTTAVLKWIETRMAARATTFLEDLKSNETFLQYATPHPTVDTPSHWTQTSLLNFRGWSMEPKIAAVFDRWDSALKSNQLGVILRLSRLLVSTLFWIPTVHLPNQIAFFLTEVFPRSLIAPIATFKAATSALYDVIGETPRYKQYIRDWGFRSLSTENRNREFFDALARKMTAELQDETTAQRLAKAFLTTADNVVGRFEKAIGAITWYWDDIMRMTAVRQLEALGMNRAKAIREVHKWVPNYELPAYIKLPGGRATEKLGIGLAKILRHPLLFMFQAYHTNVIAAYLNAVKDITNPRERDAMALAAARLSMTAFLFFVGLPLVDRLVADVTGNPRARVRRAGPLALLDHAEKIHKGEETVYQAAQAFFTPSLLVSFGIEAITGRDVFTGKPLAEPGASPLEQAKAYALGLARSLGPVADIGRAAQGTGLQGLILSKIGVSTPKLTPAEVGFMIVGRDQAQSTLTEVRKLINQGDTLKAIQLYSETRAKLIARAVNMLEDEAARGIVGAPPPGAAYGYAQQLVDQIFPMPAAINPFSKRQPQVVEPTTPSTSGIPWERIIQKVH